MAAAPALSGLRQHGVDRVAAIGKAIGLSAQQMRWALGLAATQSSGLREMFGTMTKSFHPGRAAQNGMFSALLAEADYESSERAIEAPR